MMKKLFLTSLCLCVLTSMAELPHLMFRNLNVSDGLSDNFVRSIQRDRYGTMWFVTLNSVNRYDGYTFRNYPVERDPYWNDGLEAIYETADSTVWIVGNSHNYIYHYREDYIDSHVSEQLCRYGIRDSINLLYVDENHNLWCWSDTSNTLYHYDFSKKELNSKTITGEGHPWSIYCRNNRAYLLTTDKNGTARVWNLSINTLNASPLPVPGIHVNDRTHLYIDTYDRLWLYTTNEHYLLYYDEDTQRWTDVISQSKADREIMVSAISDDGENVWLGTGNHGVYIINGRELNSIHQLRYESPVALNDNHISCFYKDEAQGIIWVGTAKLGAVYANMAQTPIRIIQMPGAEDVRFLLPDNRGNVWMGFDSQGIGVIDAKSLNVSQMTHMTSSTAGLPSNQVICSHIDSKGRQWWGSYNGSLFYMTGNKQVYRIDDYRLHYVMSLAEDMQGRIWAATFFSGLYCLEPETGRVTEYTAENCILNTNSLTDLCMFQGRTLFVGTSSGLYQLDTENGKIEEVSRDNIRALFVANDKTLWIGLRSGLVARNIASGKETRLTTSDGLAHNCICGITQDHYGNLWVSTLAGITKILPKTTDSQSYKCVAYKAYDGIGRTTFNLHAICSLPDGDILVGGLGSIVRITPKAGSSMKAETQPPRFTGLMLGNRQMEVGEPTEDGRILLRQNMLSTNSITLRYDDMNIGIEVSSMNYAHIYHQHYLYRIGENGAWTAIEGNIIRLSTLQPGTYELQVKVSEPLADMENPIARMTIHVTPPWWKSWPAYICYIILTLLMLVFVIHYFRMRYKNRMQRQQRDMEIQQQREMDEAKMRFFTNVSHDMRTPLSLIITPLQRLLKGNLNADMRTQLELINHSAETLKDEITQLLDFRKLDNSIDSPVLLTGSLNELVQNTCNDFKGAELPGGVTCSLQLCDDPLITQFDAKKMRRVVLNLVSNAIKYNRTNGTVTVSTRQGQDEEGTEVAILQVADTGIGVNRENRERIFERFFQEQHDETTYKGSGIGLHLVKQYVNMHGGTVSVSDNKPQGTVFTVTLPMRNEGTITTKQTATEEKATSSNTLLIVEDNDDFRSFLQSCLIDQYHVIMAANGKEALEQLEQHEVSLIISDVMMPVMDGIMLCQKVKTDLRFSHIPFIILTARAAEEHQVEGLQEGADDYITKPFNLDILMLRIDRLLKWSREAGERFHKMDVKPSEITVSHVDEELIKRAIALVEQNFSDSEYSVEQFCDDMGMSRSSLYKKLMAITGLAPLQFMRTLRVKRGRQLLEQGGESVSQVAWQVGLSPKQFAKYFKEEYGLSPSELSKGK